MNACGWLRFSGGHAGAPIGALPGEQKMVGATKNL
jgi:hypothetical protein